MALKSPVLNQSGVLVSIEAGQHLSIKPLPSQSDPFAVSCIQEALGSLGYIKLLGADWPERGSPSGRFGTGTTNAVLAFQKSAFPTQSSEWDSRVGQKTLRKMDERLTGKVPPKPAPQPHPQPPSGVEPDLSQLKGMRFSRPVFLGVGIRLSFSDPFMLQMISATLKGIATIPIGADVVIGQLHRLEGYGEPFALRPLAGMLIGVTGHRNAAGDTVGAILEKLGSKNWAPGIQKILKYINEIQNQFPSAGGASVSFCLLLGKGFANVGEMNGYQSSDKDELSYTLAVGEKASDVLKLLAYGVDVAKVKLQGWAIQDAAEKFAKDNTRMLVAWDVPFVSFGVEIGVTAGTTTFYSLDYDALLGKLLRLAEPLWTTSRPDSRFITLKRPSMFAARGRDGFTR